MQETYGKIDIFGISETHMHANISSEEVSIDGYTYIRKDRNHAPNGGVGCYVRKDIEFEPKMEFSIDHLPIRKKGLRRARPIPTALVTVRNQGNPLQFSGTSKQR